MLDTDSIVRSTSASLETICFLTSDRPAVLSRVLCQCTASLAMYERRARIVVFDDSQDPAAQETNQKLCCDKSNVDARINYFGGTYRHALRERFVASSIDPQVVDFGLFGMSHTTRRTGSNRNVLMLATAGALVLSIDDDMEFWFATSPDAQPGISLTDRYDPSEYWFYSSRRSLLEANRLRLSSCDVLALHSNLLGADVESGGTQGRILYTLTGIAGDCGMATPRCFWLSGASRDRMLQSPQAYETAVTSREILKVASVTTISSGRFCMTGCIGLDNREGLPPFFPLGRNTDGVFGSMIKVVQPSSLSAHLPYAMLHTPPAGVKTFGREALWRNIGHNDLARIITACLRQCVPHDGLSLTGLGERLIAFADTDADTFANNLKEALSDYLNRSLAFIRTLHEEAGDGPTSWQSDFATFAECFRASLPAEGPLFRDIPMTARYSSECAAVKDYLFLFGQLLLSWPEMIRLARAETDQPS